MWWTALELVRFSRSWLRRCRIQEPGYRLSQGGLWHFDLEIHMLAAVVALLYHMLVAEEKRLRVLMCSVNSDERVV
jgi:hypothetical protein